VFAALHLISTEEHAALHGRASVAPSEEDACCNRSDFRFRSTCAFDALLSRSLPPVLSYPPEEKTSVRITTTTGKLVVVVVVHCDSISLPM
jgi:hypothetical protein